MSFPRYAKYKDSGVGWLGQVPNHWRVSALKRIVAVPITDGPHETPDFVDTGVPFVSAEAVSSGRIDFSKVRACISEADNARYSLKYSPKLHDIYMVKSGATTGICAIVEGSTSFNIWSPLAAIRCGREAVPHFVFNFMRSQNFREAVTLNWSFGTQQNIGMGVIGDLSCALPPVEEQSVIASFLEHQTDKIDSLIAEQERLIELLQEKRQAVISQAVTKGLNPDAPMKDSGTEWLGVVPAHWKVMPLKRDLAFVTSGSRGWAERYSEDGALFVRISNLTRTSIDLDLSDVQRVAVPESAEAARTRLAPGDVLFSITAYLGSVAVTPESLEPGYVSQHVALARLHQRRLSPRWVGYASLSTVGKTWFDMQSYGGTKIQLSLDDIKCLTLPVPPIVEQEAITAYLDKALADLSALIDESYRTIALLQERRVALISAAVTGQIDVRSFADSEAAA